MLFIFGFTPIVLAVAKGKKKLIIALKFKSKHIFGTVYQFYFWLSTSFLELIQLDKKHSRENSINVDVSGCKESHFYSLPFGQAEATIY